jgi:site-specific recombinase XerD
VAAVGADEPPGWWWVMTGCRWQPVDQFLAHLRDQRRSANTVKAYAGDLMDYFEYLASRGLQWDRLRYDELAGHASGEA